MLKQLDAIPASQLSAENQVNLAIYRPQIENLAAGIRFRDYEMPFNSDSQFWSDLGFMTRRPLKDALAARNYIAKLDDVPRYFDQQIANMRAGLKRGFSVPRAVLDGRDVSIASYAEVKSPEDSEFYAPLKKLPTNIPPDEQEKLRADGARAIREHVIPAYAKLLKFFRDDYLPHARKTLAAEALPDGKAYYRQQIREYTTLDLEPEAIHEIGLKEVARIDADMQATMKETGFKGDFPAFLKFLRTDPQFYAKTPDELLMRASWIAKQVDGKLSQYFGLSAARPFRHRSRARGDRAVLDRRPRQRAHVLGQHVRPAVAAAVQPARADAARIGAGPCVAGRARRRAEGAAGIPQQELHLRVRRRLGALLRKARQGNGHLSRRRTRNSAARRTRCGAPRGS